MKVLLKTENYKNREFKGILFDKNGEAVFDFDQSGNPELKKVLEKFGVVISTIRQTQQTEEVKKKEDESIGAGKKEKK